MDRRVKRIIKTMLKFGLTLVALYFVFSRIEFSSVAGIIGGADPVYLLLALVLLALMLFSFSDMPLPHHRWAAVFIPVGIVAFYIFLKLVYRHFLAAFTPTTLLSLGVQIMQLLSAWLIIMALGGGDGHLMDYLLVFLVSSIVAVLPISIGGMGVRELTFLYGAQFLGINSALAVSISLVFYLITAVVSFGGLWYVVKPIVLAPSEPDQQSFS
ncbi:MAG: lysylphosphatidylglycerol synthase domain-containing protein [Bacteroidales bacterium]|nr:lysylphosphatidylglycerol synthase domain-containing protein [Bacteroidales bacterium]